MKKLLEQTQDRRNIFNEKYRKSKHYYLNENDITIKIMVNLEQKRMMRVKKGITL